MMNWFILPNPNSNPEAASYLECSALADLIQSVTKMVTLMSLIALEVWHSGKPPSKWKKKKKIPYFLVPKSML